MLESDDEPKKLKFKFLIEAEIIMNDESEVAEARKQEDEVKEDFHNKEGQDTDQYVNPILSKSYMEEVEGGREALESFFNQPDKAHLRPDRMLKRFKEEAPKLRKLILRSGSYFD